MARLPQPGGDDNTWGSVLNDYLSVAHDTDGTIKANSVVEGQLSAAVQTKLNTVGSGGVASVNTRTGAVTLTKSDVGLGNVDNTSDASKPVSTATQTALSGKADTVHTHTAAQLSDATTVGKSVLTAADAAAVRAVIGAGTSNLAIGLTGTTAKAGDYTPTKSDVGLGNVDNTSDTNKPISTATQTALDATVKSVNSVTPDGSGNVTISVGAGSVASTDITDSTATGRSVLTAASAAAARTAIGAGTSSLVLGSTGSTAKAGDYAPTKSDVGLGNVDNTSDANKPVSSDAQTALNLKAPLASPTFTGTVTVPTPSNPTDASTKGYIDTAISGISIGYAALPAGSTITVAKSAGTWPARPTSRTDIVVQWKGADPSPTIVSSGTGGMMDNVDIRFVTP